MNNPLLALFVTEARELIETVNQGLLELENAPGDSEVMNRLFRALHTLKGSSGLFDPEYAALQKLAHAGEDLLDNVRNGKLAFNSTMTDLILASMDLMGRWLDETDREVFSPEAAAGPSAELAAQLRGLVLGEAVSGGVASASTISTASANPTTSTVASAVAPLVPPPELPVWLEGLTVEERLGVAERCAGDGEVLTFCYTPNSDCFFFGMDPINQLRQLSNLLSLRFELTGLAPDAEGYDPFQCALRIVGILQQSREKLESVFRYVLDHVNIAAIPMSALLSGHGVAGLSELDREAWARILDGQSAVLELPATPESWDSRIGSTVRVLRNGLLVIGLPERLAQLEQVSAQAATLRNSAPLLALVEELLLEVVPPVAPVVKETVPASPERGASAGSGPASAPAAPTVSTDQESGKIRVLKVDQERIDRIMDLVGELVVAKNSIPFLAERAVRHHGVLKLGQEIMEFHGLVSRLSDEMQSAVMQVRMMPVASVFQRFPRLVRDISRKLGKQVSLVMDGGETEADKNIIEGLSDPLIHLLRNSLDHGLELPEERIAAGKEPEGEIALNACHEGGRVVIEIRDNGRGIDPERVKRKAREKGVIDDRQMAEMSDQEAIQLIFAAGFSTVEKVSDLSGRGVGMDVVRSAVEAVGGTVLLQSLVGQGTTVRLELPMSMAVSRVMLVEDGGAMYGIPFDKVVETVRLPRSAIHAIQDREATYLRGHLLPLVRLADLLTHREGERASEAREEEAVLVVRPFDEEIGLIVGEFNKGMDIVLKPLDGILANISGCAGGALLGDGRVLLVLNLQELL